jgi:hypothetical protein
VENSISLKAFLEEYGESMAEKVTEDLEVIHDPLKEREEALEEVLQTMTKRPFPSQSEIIKACYKSLTNGNKALYMVCEMGTGKTLMAISVALMLHRFGKAQRALVLCPPHLVPKWIQEIKDSVPGAKAYNLNNKNILRRLELLRKQPRSAALEFYVIGRERAKAGFMWRPAVVTKRGKHFCPRCGKDLLDSYGFPLPLFEKNIQGRFKKKFSCRNMVSKWAYDSEANDHLKIQVPCGEQLWQPDNGKRGFRKAIPAKLIKAKMKGSLTC